jgi:hypothetical protein
VAGVLDDDEEGRRCGGADREAARCNALTTTWSGSDVVERTGSRGRGGAAAARWIGRVGGWWCGGSTVERTGVVINCRDEEGKERGAAAMSLRGGGGSPWGKGEAAGCRALVCGLPNDGTI